MTETQLKIIKQLFERPNDQNATERILKTQLGIIESDFRSAILSLLSDKIIVVLPEDNQTALNEKENTTDHTAYALTLKGAVILSEYNKSKGFNAYIDRNGKWIAFVVLILGAVGLIIQIWTSRESLNLQEKQLKQDQSQSECYEIYIHERSLD